MTSFPFRRRRTAPLEPVGECQGADFSRVVAALAEGIDEHVRRDQMSPVREAVFRARGGQHAPGERCPSEPDPEPIHAMGCDLFADGEFCTCGAAAGHHARLAAGTEEG